jgi:membrane protease YdiL (CAAX protease family)
VTTDATDATDASADAAVDAPPRQRWGLLEPLGGFVAGVFGAAMGAGAAAAITGASLTDVTLATTAGGLAGMWSVYLLTWYLLSKRRGTGRPVLDIGLRVEGWKDVGLGAAAGLFASFVLVNLVYVVLQAANVIDQGDLNRLDDPARQLSDIAKGPGFLVLAALVGIGAPVVEEVFFRGLLQPAAIRRFGPVAGVVFTALFFGAAHLEALQFPALAVFGLVLGALAYRTKRLGPGIAAHIVFNALTLIALAAAR